MKLNSISQALWLLQTVLNNQCPRPRNRFTRRLYYSGQRKNHTVKNLYTTNQNGLIIYKTKHKQIGKRHDYKIYKDNHPKLPNEVTSMYDLGFLGVEDDYPEQKSSLPIKKEKGCELMVQQKVYNRNHSAKRIVIEHTIARLKNTK